MRFQDEIELYLADEMDPADRRAFEARVDADPASLRQLEQERRLRTRLRTSFGAGEMSPAERGAIWARFEAETTPVAPVLSGPGSSGFGFSWRLLALPAAAGLVALVAWGAGLFDAEPRTPEIETGRGLQARAEGDGLTIFQQSPVIRAVFTTDRLFRQQRGSSRADAEYPSRLRRALDGMSMVSTWFDEKAVTSREVKIGEIERMISECSSNPTRLPDLPEKAHIEACCVHEVEIDGRRMRIPHVMFCCEGKKLSAYFLCGSLRPAVEAAMKRCDELANTALREDAPTKIHQCRECGIFALPRGPHLMVLVSDLEPAAMDSVIELF